MIARSPCGLRTTMAIVLLLLASLAVPLEETQPLHLHDGDATGLYNEEHVLASLDSLSGDVPLPAAPAAVFVILVVPAGPLAGGARLSAPALGPAEPRAPPLA